MENKQNTDRKLVLSASQEYYNKFLEIVNLMGSDENALNYLIDKACSDGKTVNDKSLSAKPMRTNQGERYRADNPERVHPSDMANRELLEVYSSYSKLPLYSPEESDYVGKLRLEILQRMDRGMSKD